MNVRRNYGSGPGITVSRSEDSEPVDNSVEMKTVGRWMTVSRNEDSGSVDDCQ